MKFASSHPLSTACTAMISAAMQEALGILLEAHNYALDLKHDEWALAVELQAFLEAGCTRNALRWLVSKGYVKHGIEKTLPKATARSFRPTANLSFAMATCFLLTPSGVELARELGPSGAAAPPLNGVSASARPANGHLFPHWDAGLRELRLGAFLIKAFTRPAANQEVILAAFQEEGWPPRIYNPLSPGLDQDGRQRLHDAITRLNRHQKHRLLHFRTDNNGEGVRWDTVPTSPPERHLSDA